MMFGLTSISGLASAEANSMLSTTRVCTHVGPKHVEERLFLVVHAVVQLRGREQISAGLAFIYLQPSPELPKDSAPADSVLFQKLNKPLQVPVGIRLMLSYLSSIHINQNRILL